MLTLTSSVKIKIESNPHRFQCEVCEKAFHIHPELIEHMRKFHRDSYECCGLIFTTSSNLEYHKSTHGDSDCELQGKQIDIDPNFTCTEVFTYVKLKQETGNDIDLKPLSSENLESIPLDTKHYIKIEPGNIETTLLSETDLPTEITGDDQNQLNSQKTIIKFKCDVCSKDYSHKTNLDRHMKRLHTLTEEKKISCKVCDRRFYSNFAYSNHLRTHTGETPFVCSICNSGFKMQIGLRRHMLTLHNVNKPSSRNCTKERTKKCFLCSKMYVDAKGLKLHMERVHSEEKKVFRCSECPKGFLTSTELRMHTQVHSDNKPFQCAQCSRNFKSLKCLKTHYRVVHSSI